MVWALKVTGDAFRPPTSVDGSGLHAYTVYRKGEVRKNGKVHQFSGIHIGPKQDHDDDIDAQIVSAMKYLTCHADAIRDLVKSPGVESAYIDFMYNFSAKLYADVTFPVELLSALSALNIRMNLTIYNHL